MLKGTILAGFFAALSFGSVVFAQDAPAFKAIAFYSTIVEKAHVEFAKEALAFYGKLAAEKHFTFDSTTDWSNLNSGYLANYQVMVWLDDTPHTEEQKAAFQTYMEKGGGWLGFHVAAYNDKSTHWPWFVQFLGGGVFYCNNWPPMPAKVIVENNKHPATARLPGSYLSPANEFYQWIPSPRLNKEVQVLISLDPAGYPIGKKDLLTHGDVPVVWTNTRYKMIYINMGHGNKILTDETQNKLFEDSLLWLGREKSPAH